MNGKGRAIDNIFIERFWRNIKYEKIYLEPSDSDNGLELYHKIKEYMKFYNTERPHQGLLYKRPMETNLSVNKNCLCEGRSLEFYFIEKFKYVT